MDVLLSVIIAVVVFGVALGVLRFAVAKFLPEAQEYVALFTWVLLAALFIFILVQVWPYLTGALVPHHTTYR